MFDLHEIYCRRFLQRYESAQEKMLSLNHTGAAHEFELLYDCFSRECQKGISRFAGGPAGEKEAFLLRKQLEKICVFIARFSETTERIKHNLVAPPEIIKHFEEQHQFKKILLRHLTDLEKILNRSV